MFEQARSFMNEKAVKEVEKFLKKKIKKGESV